MLLGIDHLVIAVEDPDAAAATLAEKLGLDASEGGRHEALGTFNRLVWLGDSYLELIGVFDRELAERSWIGQPVLAALERGGGLATWAVAVDDLDALVRWAGPDGGLTGPIDGDRRRPDGRKVRWRLAHPPALSLTAPFVIEHDTTGAEWTPEDRAARAEQRHALGGRVRLAGIEVVSEQTPVAAGRLRRLLGTSAEPAGRGAVRIGLGSQDVRIVNARPRGLAAADLLADFTIPRRRSVMIGDLEIRLSGLPMAQVVPADSDGSGTHRDAPADV